MAQKQKHGAIFSHCPVLVLNPCLFNNFLLQIRPVALGIFLFGVFAIICDIAGHFTLRICNLYDCVIARSLFHRPFFCDFSVPAGYFLEYSVITADESGEMSFKIKIRVVISFR